MSSCAIVGLQWGDEGKGKIVDLLAEDVELVVRSQGGANAGHTVEIGDSQFILHLVPTGILRPDVRCLIGGGVVIDMSALFRELSELQQRGITWEGRLLFSLYAHVVLPYHKLLEQADERARGPHKIGTTLRGIGPAYADKASRRGVRLGDLYRPEYLREKLAMIVEAHREKIETLPDVRLPDIEAVAAELGEYAALIQPYLVNASDYLHDEIKSGRRILYEGAQGTLLDLDFGTYPFVTSSTTSIGGILTGLGVNTRAVDKVVGVTKAYCTRVGNGPFPTELTDGLGDKLREQGKEYGATTGRPRRCGWVDGVLLRHASRLNGTTHLAITKLDVLDGMESLLVCTHYDGFDGPLDLGNLDGVSPVYEEWPGWKESTSGISDYGKLPTNCKKYLDRLAEISEAKLHIVSTGPRRRQTIRL